MAEVSVRELRNHGAEVLDRVVGGEVLTLTRDGRPVAELRPLARRPLPASTLLARRRRLPVVDSVRLRADVDELVDPSL